MSRRLGFDALVRQEGTDRSTVRGSGDVTVVLKRRFAIDEALVLGVELGTKLPVAKASLGSGHSDLGGMAAGSRDAPVYVASTWRASAAGVFNVARGRDPARPWRADKALAPGWRSW